MKITLKAYRFQLFLDNTRPPLFFFLAGPIRLPVGRYSNMPPERPAFHLTFCFWAVARVMAGFEVRRGGDSGATPVKGLTEPTLPPG